MLPFTSQFIRNILRISKTTKLRFYRKIDPKQQNRGDIGSSNSMSSLEKKIKLSRVDRSLNFNLLGPRQLAPPTFIKPIFFIKAYSGCYPSEVGKWVPASAGSYPAMISVLSRGSQSHALNATGNRDKHRNPRLGTERFNLNFSFFLLYRHLWLFKLSFEIFKCYTS